MNFRLITLALLLIAAPFFSKCQFAAIQNTNIQIYGVLNEQQIAWSSNKFFVRANKETGDLYIKLAIDDLTNTTTIEDFKPEKEKNEGKFIILSGRVPLDDVLGEKLSVIDLNVPLNAEFNGIESEIQLTFTVLLMGTRGFSIMVKGELPQRVFEVENLEKFEDNLIINFSFTGY